MTFTCRVGSLENIQIMREITLYQDRQPLAAGLFFLDDLKKDIIKSLSWNDNYFGDNVYLIAGDHSCYGTDPGESIIRNAVVVGIIEIVK